MKSPNTSDITVQIVHIEGPRKGQIDEITASRITIGRDPSNDVVFDQNLKIVSRHHAEILREGARFLLKNLSLNGCYVNGRLVQEGYLKLGDVISFGNGGPKVSFLYTERLDLLDCRVGLPPHLRKASPAPNVAVPKKGRQDSPYAVAQVYFATDRNLTESKKVAELFGANRAMISYGTCEVSIPRDHRMGELESPSIWRLEFRENPTEHVVLLGATVLTKESFFADLTACIHASSGKNAFIFVHGYNVTFEDAARRTAQMSYDLGFDGAPVFYSWPSQGTMAAYTVDEQNVEWAQANLKEFLNDFFERSNAHNVFLIAHSMGNRALTRAVASLLGDKPSIRQRLREVILTAPDIDAEVFRRDIAPALAASDRPITLYAIVCRSCSDRIEKVHGYPRAGDSGPGLVVIPGVETIDATGTDTSLIGHSYFAETRSVLSDIFYVIRNSQRAEQRFGLHGIDTPSGRYWKFKN